MVMEQSGNGGEKKQGQFWAEWVFPKPLNGVQIQQSYSGPKRLKSL